MANPQAIFRHLLLRVTVPAAGLVALLLAALLVTVLVVAAYQSDVARGEQAKLAEGAIKVRGGHIEKTALDYGAWDDAVDHLVVRPDPDWADENIGRPTSENLGFDMVLVIAPDNSLVYTTVAGKRTTVALDDVRKSGILDLVEDQRRGARTGSSSGVILNGDHLAIAALGPIRRLEASPDDTGPQHLLVFVDAIDAVLLDELAKIYLLPHLRLTSVDEHDPASIELKTNSGHVVGALAWDAARPGDTLLRSAVPVWGVLAVGFTLLTALIFRQARSAARLIANSEDRARHDFLTQLPNRVLFFERLDAASRVAAEGGPSFAVLYVDLDGFKSVNDLHGHDVGDAVLKAVAERMQGLLGPGDIAARLGGDEFVLLLFGRSHVSEVSAVAQSLIRALSRPIEASPDLTLNIGATVGASMAPADASDPLILLRNADQALFLGKRSGKGQVRFHLRDALQEAG